MRLQHTSPFIEVFRNYITADDTNGVPPIVTITVKDPSSYEQLFATYAWLNNEGTREWGNETTEREYVFFAVDTEDGPNTAITSIDQYLA